MDVGFVARRLRHHFEPEDFLRRARVGVCGLRRLLRGNHKAQEENSGSLKPAYREATLPQFKVISLFVNRTDARTMRPTQLQGGFTNEP